MRRITVEEVVSAYAKVRIQPKRRDWGDGVTCGCPVTALVMARGYDLNRYKKHNESLFACACEILGTETAYLSGFIGVLDYGSSEPDPSHERTVEGFAEGIEDGTAVAKALWPTEEGA